MILKGKFAEAHMGNTWNAVHGYASGADCEHWCDKYHLQRRARFDVTMYGDDLSLTLAKAWAHRMGYLYNIWLNHADDEYPIHLDRNRCLAAAACVHQGVRYTDSKAEAESACFDEALPAAVSRRSHHKGALP